MKKIQHNRVIYKVEPMFKVALGLIFLFHPLSRHVLKVTPYLILTFQIGYDKALKTLLVGLLN